MKTTAWRTLGVLCLSVLATGGTFRAAADGDLATAEPEKTYTGTIASVDPQSHVLNMTEFFGDRKFNMANDCTYFVAQKNKGSVADLRSGKRVVLTYRDVDGTRVVTCVAEISRRYEGTVQSVDLKDHTMTLRMVALDREFRFSDDCRVTLHNGQTARVTDLKPGDEVSVTYETPDGNLCARQIAQTAAPASDPLAIQTYERD